MQSQSIVPSFRASLPPVESSPRIRNRAIQQTSERIPLQSSITFQQDNVTEDPYIQVIDRISGELLREIPPEGQRNLRKVLAAYGVERVDVFA